LRKEADPSDELPLNAMANASIKMPERPAPLAQPASRLLSDPPVAAPIRRGGAARSGQGTAPRYQPDGAR
jgi:hypothetical protein